MLAVDLLQVELHGQQAQQVVALVGLVGLLHQSGLALTLNGVGLAVGVQRAGQLAEDLAHRLTGLLRRRLLSQALGLGPAAFG